MSELTTFLKQTDIFYQLTQPELKMMATVCQEYKYEMGEIVLEEGTNSKDLYIIAKGEVEILVNPAIVGGPESPKGTVTIATLRRGQSFGEIALVDEGLRSATVRAAQKDTRLLILAREKVLRLCEAHPQLGYRLTQIIIRQDKSYLGMGRIGMILLETGSWQNSSTASRMCETFS